MAETVDEILDRIRRAGGRVTTARRLVIETLLATPGHVSADDIAANVRREHPEVHLSTVYRTLESLEELGIVRHTHVGHGAATYHVGPLHQHLVCETCGAVVDVPASALDELASRLRDEYDFDLHVGHFALLGRCLAHE